jgi:hypothetical protein
MTRRATSFCWSGCSRNSRSATDRRGAFSEDALKAGPNGPLVAGSGMSQLLLSSDRGLEILSNRFQLPDRKCLKRVGHFDDIATRVIKHQRRKRSL